MVWMEKLVIRFHPFSSFIPPGHRRLQRLFRRHA